MGTVIQTLCHELFKDGCQLLVLVTCILIQSPEQPSEHISLEAKGDGIFQPYINCFKPLSPFDRFRLTGRALDWADCPAAVGQDEEVTEQSHDHPGGQNQQNAIHRLL
jgi:hypothetical protein